jgi:hypothetical protein
VVPGLDWHDAEEGLRAPEQCVSDPVRYVSV